MKSVKGTLILLAVGFFVGAAILSVVDWCAALNHKPDCYVGMIPYPWSVLGTFVNPILAIGTCIVAYAPEEVKCPHCNNKFVPKGDSRGHITS